jgi:hypothetical protein
MEQNVPKHRKWSLRYLAEEEKVSHTTIRRHQRIDYAAKVLYWTLGREVAMAVESKQIRVGQKELWMWACIARKDPDWAWHICKELAQNPNAPLWQKNAFIRGIEEELDACAFVREHQHEYDLEEEARQKAFLEQWEEQKAEQKAEPESSAPAEATDHPHFSDEELAKVKA